MRVDNNAEDDGEFVVTQSVRDAARALSAPVEVRHEWREALLNEVASADVPVPDRKSTFWRPVTIRPLYAIAACLAAMVVGAVGASTFMRGTSNSNVADANARVTDHAPVPLQNGSTGFKTIRFALVAPNASNVSIVGDFNGWNPKATPMKFVRDGNSWLVDMPLSAGRHLYAFVVDGDIIADPSAARVVDNDFGVQNSVVLVGAP